MKPAMKVLEFEQVRGELARCTMSYRGKQHVDNLEPTADKLRIERWLKESEEALAIVASGTSVPIPSLEGLERVEQLLGKGYVFTPADFEAVGQLLRSTMQLQLYLRRKRDLAPTVSSYAESLHELTDLREEIENSIYLGDVLDTASDGLHRAKKQESIIESRLRKKLESSLQKYRTYLQESMVLQRNGRYVLAVRKDMKSMVPGSAIDESSSGQTVFVEPSDVSVLQQELDACKAEVEQEKYQVLCSLSALLDSCRDELKANLETIGICDFVIAKGKYGRIIDGKSVKVGKHGVIDVRQARHPLLRQGATPIDFRLGDGYRALIITGPNTGGKTVCLKTIGLLTLMMQCGLLVPAEQGSTLTVFDDILADIGDGQSISQSLSTFSAHVRSLVEILSRASARTLVLLDELASGTDPGEGIGLSIAVLERLFSVGSATFATTHFSEIKDFAQMTTGFEVARMEFDVESLQPLYRLRIGEAGDSYALLIAKKLGISEDLIARAGEIVREGRLGREGRDGVHGQPGRTQREAPPATQQAPTDEATAHQPPKLSQSERATAAGVTSTRASSAAASGRAASGAAASSAAASSAAASSAAASSAAASGGVSSSKAAHAGAKFQIGDRVWIHAMKRSGIVASEPDERGNLDVIVKKERISMNHKRISPYLSKEELYPDAASYDLDIVLESKYTRKKRKLMGKRHVEGLTIEHPPTE